jgi:ADP-dependent NAD(P)H-hydrate dehydratase / NAD(P)H-hydrate epimerase
VSVSNYRAVDYPPIPAVREVIAHKGDFGHVLVVAGSRRMMGAAVLCCRGATRAGAGLVTLACPESMQRAVISAIPTIMTLPLSETQDGSLKLGAWATIEAFCNQATVIACGPGLGQNRSTQMLVRRMVQEVPIPLVLDADGLNALAECPRRIGLARAPVVVTPHPGEMARLTGRTIEVVQGDRRGAATHFAEQTGSTVVLKGARTVVAGRGRVYINGSGNPYMASGGTGDVLTGMVAGMIAQQMGPFDAARTAVYWHGLAADRAPNAGGPGAVTAQDIIEQLRRSAADIDWHNEEIELRKASVYDPDRSDDNN